jgi:hypothetical protein
MTHFSVKLGKNEVFVDRQKKCFRQHFSREAKRSKTGQNFVPFL